MAFGLDLLEEWLSGLWNKARVAVEPAGSNPYATSDGLKIPIVDVDLGSIGISAKNFWDSAAWSKAWEALEFGAKNNIASIQKTMMEMEAAANKAISTTLGSMLGFSGMIAAYFGDGIVLRFVNWIAGFLGFEGPLREGWLQRAMGLTDTQAQGAAAGDASAKAAKSTPPAQAEPAAKQVSTPPAADITPGANSTATAEVAADMQEAVYAPAETDPGAVKMEPKETEGLMARFVASTKALFSGDAGAQGGNELTYAVPAMGGF